MPMSRAIRRTGRCELALEELAFHSAELNLLGTYPASPFRQTLKLRNGNGDLARKQPAGR